MSSFIGSRKQFVEKYGSFIKEICEGTGLLPGTVVAQAIIESSGKYQGTWYVGGSGLSRKANNFFGIKCGTNWKGKTYNSKTGEYSSSGEYYFITSCFRAYNSVEDSIKDHLNFLQTNKRYANAGVFKAKTVKDQAIGLKKAGYATAPNYANTILSVYNDIAPLLDEQKKKPSIIQYASIGLIGTALLILINKINIK